MSEVDSVGTEAGAAPEAAVPAGPVGFGRTLAQAREQQGISLADMAARLRLHPRQVTALEEERLDSLPEAPFVRGFVRNYAKELKLDPAPLLAELGEKLPVASPAVDSLVGSGGSSAEVRRAGMDRSSRIAVVGGSVAVLLVLGIIGWIASTRVQAPDGDSPSAGSVLPAKDAATESAATAAGVPAPVTAAPADQAVSAEPPAVAVVPTPPTAPVSSAPAAAPTGGGGLRLVVGERPSWVEITQADGRVVLTGLLEAGTERRLGNPQPPLQLVIGNASSVTLEYRGKTIDLQRHVRANDLARLSLE
jgi:cytoskeleton protein RodZ